MNEKRKKLDKKMQVLEIEEKIFQLEEDINTLFEMIKEVAGDAQHIIERSKAYWFNNMISFIDGDYQIGSLKDVLDYLKKEHL